MTTENRPAAQVIDEVRAAHKHAALCRADAIARIREVVDVTETGAADLLDHELDARVRYSIHR